MGVPLDSEIEALSSKAAAIWRLGTEYRTFLDQKETEEIDLKIAKIESSIVKVHHLRAELAELVRISKRVKSICVSAIVVLVLLCFAYYLNILRIPVDEILSVWLLPILIYATACGLCFQKLFITRSAINDLRRFIEFEMIDVFVSTNLRVAIKGVSTLSIDPLGVSVGRIFKLERKFLVETLRCCEYSHVLQQRGNKTAATELINKLEDHATSVRIGWVEIPLKIELPHYLQDTSFYHFS